MLSTLALVFLTAWVLGVLQLYVVGDIVHVLLVLSALLFLKARENAGGLRAARNRG